MLRFTAALQAWGQKNFSAILKQELQRLGTQHLPLHLGTAHGGYVGDEPITVTVNRFADAGQHLEGSVGIFFTEIMINCGCGDDPVPVNAHCQLAIRIDKDNGLADVQLIEE